MEKNMTTNELIEVLEQHPNVEITGVDGVEITEVIEGMKFKDSGEVVPLTDLEDVDLLNEEAEPCLILSEY